MRYLKIILLSAITYSSGYGQKIELISTTEKEPWKSEKNLVSFSTTKQPDVMIDRNTKLQTIEGFGGCFNELGWTALSQLSEKERKDIFRELFAPDSGAGFTVCRMPVGANDFSLDWYSYDEKENDFDMAGFSIANDLKTLVPYIREAKHYNPSLKLWASPWSPPSWMKWNKHYACGVSWPKTDPKYRNGLSPDRAGKEGTNMFIQEDKYFKAYALYFSRFIEEYRKQGITVSMIMPQNEFNSCQVFPSCTWTASGLSTFIGRYLGPAMSKQNVEIMFGTMERPNEALIDTILNNPESGKYIKGVGFQWAGKQAIAGIHKRYSDLKLYQSEQECGDGKNSWTYCKYCWGLMKHYISNGASAYHYWNIALEEGGISRWGWSQNSLITVNKENKTYHYNHEYYLIRHFSQFVKPGAKLLVSSGEFNDILAFENPDKSVVVVLSNEGETDKTITFGIGGKNYSAQLKANSFNTVVIE